MVARSHLVRRRQRKWEAHRTSNRNERCKPSRRWTALEGRRLPPAINARLPARECMNVSYSTGADWTCRPSYPASVGACARRLDYDCEANINVMEGLIAASPGTALACSIRPSAETRRGPLGIPKAAKGCLLPRIGFVAIMEPLKDLLSQDTQSLYRGQVTERGLVVMPVCSAPPSTFHQATTGLHGSPRRPVRELRRNDDAQYLALSADSAQVRRRANSRSAASPIGAEMPTLVSDIEDAMPDALWSIAIAIRPPGGRAIVGIGQDDLESPD